MKQLIEFLPMLAFAIAYVVKDFNAAVLALMVGYTFQIILSWVIWRKVEKMHLAIYGLLLVSGSLSLFFNDSRFLIWKFTIVYWAFTLALVGAQWLKGINLTQRALEGALNSSPDIKINAPPSAWTMANKSVALFFFLIGVLNLIIAYNFSESTWVMFKVFGSLVLTVLGLIALMVYLFQFKEETDTASATEAAPTDTHPTDPSP